MEKRKYKVGIVTLSDKGSRGEREDVSGPKIQELLPDDQYAGCDAGSYARCS